MAWERRKALQGDSQMRTPKVRLGITFASAPALVSKLVGLIGMSQSFGGLSTQTVRDAVLNVLSLKKEGSRGTEGQPAPSQILTVMHPHLNLTAPAHFKQR
jgi:hypothetical protein